jgi:hypothetical protein
MLGRPFHSVMGCPALVDAALPDRCTARNTIRVATAPFSQFRSVKQGSADAP